MTCTAHCRAIEKQFDPRIATREITRYRRNGPSPSTRRLLSAIRETGVTGATVLDAGGGIGAIAHELLDAGSEHATIIDASPACLSAAREEAERRKRGARLTVVQGDFVTLAGGVAAADIVTLDKVVCCYPDMERLLATSTGRARRLYGIVYPRDGWWMRLANAAQNALRAVRGNAFRSYVFSSVAIDAAIRHAGFSLRHHDAGLVWVVALYERQGTLP